MRVVQYRFGWDRRFGKVFWYLSYAALQRGAMNRWENQAGRHGAWKSQVGDDAWDTWTQRSPSGIGKGDAFSPCRLGTP